MLISASRRTDIPAFYGRWFVNRLRAGFVDVVNPFNPRQKRRVNLSPDSVDAIIFWTRNPRPLFRFLEEIDRAGYHCYFTYTITGYPREMERCPRPGEAIETFKELSDRIGPDRVIWRYDPIVMSSLTDVQFHQRNFSRIATTLSGYTRRVIVSFLDFYSKPALRMKRLADRTGIAWFGIEGRVDQAGSNLVSKMLPGSDALEMARYLSQAAEGSGMEIQSCSEKTDMSQVGIKAGKCIDTDLLNRLFGLDIPYRKDAHQRKECLCAESVDVGAYETCGYRCIYCYACKSFQASLKNLRKADVNSACLWPH